MLKNHYTTAFSDLSKMFESALFGEENGFDLSQTENEVLLELPVPGYKKDQIVISIVNGLLKIEGENRRRNGDYTTTGIHYGKFERKFTVPDDLDADMISAKLEDGILQVTIPKRSQPKKKIKIE